LFQFTEENTRNKGIYFGRREYIEKAEKMKTPSCEKLQKIFNHHG